MKFSKEEEYLRKKDKKLKKIIDENGHITFMPVKKNQLIHLSELYLNLYQQKQQIQFLKVLEKTLIQNI